MSTNPNNAVGTNAAYDGRTSVKAFNDGIGAYSRGILSGWACSPSTGMTVSLGGDGTTRDIAIAEDAGGNKITVNNISESPINVTMGAAPATNSRIDVIVAYVDNPPQGSATSIDNPGACGLIAVEGTAAADPVAPNDSAIRTAITADGASGATAYYVVLATITIASGTTDLTSDNIAAGPSAGIGAQNIDFTTLNKFQTFLVANLYNEFTATIPGTLMVIGVGSSTWGYAGGEMTFKITKDSGNATLVSNPSITVRGGDAIGRTVVCAAKLTFTANQSAKLTLSKVSGANPQNLNFGFMFGIFIPSQYT